MFNYPFRIPTDNIHQIVLHQPDRRQNDFERLDDIGADALAAARDAVEAIAELPL